MAQETWTWRRKLVLAVGAVLLWQAGSWWIEQRSETNRLVNQIWLERMPSNARDMIWHLIAIEHDGGRVGTLGRASRWRVASDGFLWERKGDQLDFVTPQNGCRSSLKTRVWKCAGEAPKPFELCLELVGHGQRYLYYSRQDWVIRPRGKLDRQIEEELRYLGPVVQAALNAPAGEAVPEEATAAGSCSSLIRPE